LPNYKRVFVEGHTYFITMVTHLRKPILIDYIDILREVFVESKKIYTYEISAISILPDHLHMMIAPENAEEYPKIISYVKRKFTYLLHQKGYETDDTGISSSKRKKGESNIWQRRYYEHTIRGQKDFLLHCNYIHYNPVKHGHVEAAIQWEYGSFAKYVKLGWYDAKWGDFSNDVSLGE